MAEGEKSILDRAIAHCWSNDFLGVFRDFFAEHAGAFAEKAEGKCEQDEHDLEHYDLFQQYLRLYESQLEDFLRNEDSSSEEFYKEVREAQETSTDPDVLQFVDCLLASADYDSFHNVMIKEAKSQARRRATEGADGGRRSHK